MVVLDRAAPFDFLLTGNQKRQSSFPSPVAPTLMEQMARAASTGWRNLGSLSGGNVFHESDILYNTDDSMYYVFSTQVDGNTGLGNARVDMRRASTPEGIVSASGADYVQGVSNGVLYYPTVIKEGSGGSSAWHIWGTNGFTSVAHQIFTGASPNWGSSGAVSVGFSLPVGDPSVRKHPVDASFPWYSLGLLSDGRMNIRKTANIASTNTWTSVRVNVWDAGGGTGGFPSWAQNPTPDPNLAFIDGHVYMFFTGGAQPLQWNTGVVELDPTTYLAIGTPIMLQTYGSYAPWQNSVMSDNVFLRVSGQPDRIFGFGIDSWGCLDLY